MARHSIEDWRDNIVALEDNDMVKFLKAFAKSWEVPSNDKELKGLIAGDGGEEVADYVLSFVNDGKQALQDSLLELSERNLIDNPYEQADDDEDNQAEEERKPRSRKTVEKKVVKKNSSNKTETRGRKPLDEDAIEEMREVLRETGSISETSERTGRARATIMHYIKQDEREELGVRVWGSGKVHQKETTKKPSREESRGRGRPRKEESTRNSRRNVENERGRRSSRGR